MTSFTATPPDTTSFALSSHETTGWKPVVHDRHDACLPPRARKGAGIRRRVVTAALMLTAVTSLAAAGDWNGYEQRDFAVDGHNCLLVLPKTPATGKP